MDGWMDGRMDDGWMDGQAGRQAGRQAGGPANDGLRPEQAISLSAKQVNERIEFMDSSL
jgi:hypothetical protein